MRFATSNTEQWPIGESHSGETRSTGPSQQIDEHGFCLVIRGVAGEHIIGEDGIPRIASPSFQVGAWRQLNGAQSALNIELFTDRLHECKFTRGIGTQSMVDMPCRYVSPGASCQEEERE
jgi:hypothetical protein